MAPMKTVTLADGEVVPALGQGTWFLGDDPWKRDAEIATLREGIELGLTLVDTAEMYGDGRSEDLVGEAIAPVRDRVFLVDKVLPWNASRKGAIQACERSLEILGTDWIDLYLLHWPGPHAVEETVDAFEELVARGLIGSWGISNFDAGSLGDFPSAPLVNQVLYNPSRRGPEFDLFPAQARLDRPVATMAYSPIEQGRLLDDPVLEGIAANRGVSVAQILLAWAIRSGEVIAIPKASTPEHVRDNAQAGSLHLTDPELAEIDRAFPAPRRKVPLEML
ncbi:MULTISPECIES: aldo/keto reductase [Arthrobacter]|uniref:Aldo/keto reductase n=2 Tax=Arthrobacter TaxID=1663 RepID=A0ABU9KNJ8_9MICC|nr:aldo/keto reductase [Arthrobacter sp. YJM1]MDP5228417.1 aldo/keto reductase [Arthrobacter sp. YJM1]